MKPILSVVQWIKKLKIWNIKRENEIKTLSGHTVMVLGIDIPGESGRIGRNPAEFWQNPAEIRRIFFCLFAGIPAEIRPNRRNSAGIPLNQLFLKIPAIF